jgi:hypothetical protein
MISPALLTKGMIAEAERIQAAADETFGEESRAMRLILGMAIGDLVERGGVPATIAYLTSQMALFRKLDDEDPGPPPPAAPS